MPHQIQKFFSILLLSVNYFLPSPSPTSAPTTFPSAAPSAAPTLTPTFSPPRFVHIHIPKTGGVAVESYLSNYYPWEFIFTWDHNKTVSAFKDKICLVVIREPRDRFMSSYQYWRYGSSLFFRDTKSVLASSINLTDAETWVPPISSIFDFIRAAGNTSHPHHEYVMQRLNATREGRGIDDSQTWGDHFRPQSYWLRGGIRQKIILLRYSSTPEIFSKRFAQALHFLSLPSVNATLTPINTSRKKPSPTDQSNVTNTTNLPFVNHTALPRDDTALEPQYRQHLLKYLHHSPWIKRFYQSDLRLWSQIQSDFQSGEKHWLMIF
jgi:hypothetical protein